MTESLKSKEIHTNDIEILEQKLSRPDLNEH